MPRTFWAAIVLTVAFTAAVVGPAATGLRVPVPGVAVRPPIPDPPEVGDCLITPYYGAESVVAVEVAGGAAPYADCRSVGADGSVYGEIVSVHPGIHTFPAMAAGLPMLDVEVCESAARDYLGWIQSTWSPVFDSGVALVGPDLDQYASGQRWIACAITSGSRGYPAAGGGAGIDPRGWVYGRCADRRGVAHPRVRCDEPHDTEEFGVATVVPADVPALVDSCAALISARTGLADPTGGGSLAVVLIPDHPVAGDRVQLTVCAVRVVDGRMLGAGLVGLGNRPLPLG